MRNKGAAGVDGRTVFEFKAWLQQHWPSVKEALLAGEYVPAAIRKVEIPKPNGGVRTLGIPTVLDRLIQQALLQVLQPEFEPEFSEHSYGFRPGRNAWQAVQRAQSYIREGSRWVVDLDLEKFFDRVNHDILMSRVARRVKDERILKLIRRYLEAGMMSEGTVSARAEGTPQGGPLSPLLSNILLTDLDRELERRGHRFCRYADDCNIYVKSEAAGQHAMAAITGYLERKLKLQVNRDKSAVARPWQRKFLGYSVTRHEQARLKIADSSLKRLKDRVREIVVGNASRNLGKTVEALNPVLRGWTSYFRLTEVKGVRGRRGATPSPTRLRAGCAPEVRPCTASLAESGAASHAHIDSVTLCCRCRAPCPRVIPAHSALRAAVHKCLSNDLKRFTRLAQQVGRPSDARKRHGLTGARPGRKQTGSSQATTGPS